MKLKYGRTFCETCGSIHYQSRIGSLIVGIGSILTAAHMTVRALALSLGVDKMTALKYSHLIMIVLSKKKLPYWLSGHAWVDGEANWLLQARRVSGAGG